jgi:hypothetical protein
MTRAPGAYEEIAMTTNARGGSAEIYQFPVRGRFATADQQTQAHDSRVFSRAAAVAVGGAWYHDEAIEAELTRKN